MSVIEYDWLTHEQAVAELEAGREVVLIIDDINFILVYEYKVHSVVKNKDELCNELKFDQKSFKFKLRKPLTPEQIISSGVRLVGMVNGKFYDYPVLVIESSEFSCDVISGDLVKVVERELIKFSTNKNGNYLTIAENGEWREVLK